jgi:pimeloyl-ACP methyl ester carboxylesterase
METIMASPTPVVFVHGLWLHATSWNDWVDLFREAGYAPIAPGWPGDSDTVEECRKNPDAVADQGIDDVVGHYAEIIKALDAKPILIGHSFGGLVVEKLLGMNLGVSAVAIDAAPIKGVLPLPISSLRVAFAALKNPANKHRAVSLTPEQFRYGFGNAISEAESAALFQRWTIPSPGKPLFEAAGANFSPHSPAKVDTDNEDRGPLLLMVGGKDHTVPEAIAKSTLKRYSGSAAVTEFEEFPDRGHSLTIDTGWRKIADTSLAWLDKHLSQHA